MVIKMNQYILYLKDAKTKKETSVGYVVFTFQQAMDSLKNDYPNHEVTDHAVYAM